MQRVWRSLPKYSSKNAAIKSFTIRYISKAPSRDPHTLYGIWLEALRRNEGLEQMSIPSEIWNEQQWDSFKAILSSKHDLKKIYIRFPSENYPLLKHICHALEDSGVSSQVSCGDYLIEDKIDLLKCKLFSGIRFVRDVREDVKAAALRQLLQCDHVTSLHLQIPRGNLTVCTALAEYVHSTSVLRKLEARMLNSAEQDYSDEWWNVIVRSLSKNKSIKELVFHARDMSDWEVKSLADAINASRNIRKLTYGDTAMRSLRSFVNRLSAKIVQNNTLLSVVFKVWSDEEWLLKSMKAFAIYEATRRNSDLLSAAAGFLKPTELDRVAMACMSAEMSLVATGEGLRLASGDGTDVASVVVPEVKSMGACTASLGGEAA
ncbi:hypothetical protein MTO96_041430 [Rhipicephalus appendiculatus]